MIVDLIFTNKVAWRVDLAIGIIPPLSLFFLRLRLKESEKFNRETLKYTHTPWRLVIK